MDPELGGRGPPEISRPPLGGHVGSWSPSAHLSRVFKRRRRVLAQWFVSLAASPATGPFDTPPAPAARAADGNLLGREEAAGAGPPWAVTGKAGVRGLRCARCAHSAAGGCLPGAGNKLLGKARVRISETARPVR